MKKTWLPFLPGIIWLAMVTVLLILPGSAFPQENWFSRIWFDKWVHTGLFAVMVPLWCRASVRADPGKHKRQMSFMMIALASLAYGVGMEFVQKYLVANRSFDTGDIIADGIGCLAGWIWSRGRYIKK